MIKKQFYRFSSRLFVTILLTLAGCGSEPAPVERDAGKIAGSDASENEAEQRRRCRAPAGVNDAPNSISEAVALMNALPKPLTLSCFLESLARPLALHAANSEFSAQPAAGARSPRIFVFIEPLILSVVPAGPASQLLEFGEQRAGGTSVKAELEFPITEQLDAEAPYRRVAFTPSLTVCGACHQGEKLAADIGLPLAFISPALRPLPNQRVPISQLMTERDSCDPDQEPERCALLDALLVPRPAPFEQDFPTTINTFF